MTNELLITKKEAAARLAMSPCTFWRRVQSALSIHYENVKNGTNNAPGFPLPRRDGRAVKFSADEIYLFAMSLPIGGEFKLTENPEKRAARMAALREKAIASRQAKAARKAAAAGAVAGTGG
jgi:predicted DNA-binding transcriptional regulator AlpA